MKYVVLGGTGFIGSVLARELVKSGEVVLFDKFVHQDSRLFAKELLEIGCVINDFDVSNVEALKENMPDDVDIVFHLAANSDIRSSSNTPSMDFKDTLVTTLSLIEVAKTKIIKRIVFASSSAIYGEDGLGVDETTSFEKTLNPISEYGVAKLASEYLIEMAYLRGYVESVHICRFPNVVGVNATHGILFDFFRKKKDGAQILEVLGNGKQSKPYVNVVFLIMVLIEIAKNKNACCKYYNLAPKENISVREIADLFVKISEWNVPIHYQDKDRGWPGDVPHYSFKSMNNEFEFPPSRNAIIDAIKDLLKDERFG